MSSTGTDQWEALPARRTKKHQPEMVVESGRKRVAEYQQIMENIEARRHLSNLHSTLESKDGCAGTYYECNTTHDPPVFITKIQIIEKHKISTDISYSSTYFLHIQI